MMPEAITARFTGEPSAAPATDLDHAERSCWLLCRAGHLRCALPIGHVIEIMRPLPVEQIAGAPHYVRGLSIIRGMPVPVVDLGLIVGDRATTTTRVVTVRAARVVALAVDSVLGVSTVAGETLDELPPLVRDAAPDAIAAIGRLDNGLIVFLHTTRIVPEAVLNRLDAEKAAL
ncbi:MAG TPA: chemotaxis protein CheW [Xanthobacteraceae bacterium]|nr:chemotaxis protein CheW [Xanthobacteraceae bacterium]